MVVSKRQGQAVAPVVAERHEHQWFEHLNLDGVDLGSGKRVLARGLDRKYGTTVLVTLDDEAAYDSR